DADPIGPFPRRAFQDLERAVAAPVVHEHELVRAARGVHDRGQPPKELREVPLLVVDGNDHRHPHRANSARTSRTAAIASSWSASVRPGESGIESVLSETEWGAG